MKSLSNKFDTIVVFDLETTGFSPKNDDVTEIAAIKVVVDGNGELNKDEEFRSFVRLPGDKKVPKKIVELTGITDEILAAEGRDRVEVSEKFLEFLGDGNVLLVAHNAHFDLGFLTSMLSKSKVKIKNKVKALDTLTVCRDRFGYPHKLCNAISHYGLDEVAQNSHRAIDDTAALYEVLVKIAEENDNLDEYVNVFGYNPRYGIPKNKISSMRYYEQPYNSMQPLVERIKLININPDNF